MAILKWPDPFKHVIASLSMACLRLPAASHGPSRFHGDTFGRTLNTPSRERVSI